MPFEIFKRKKQPEAPANQPEGDTQIHPPVPPLSHMTPDRSSLAEDWDNPNSQNARLLRAAEQDMQRRKNRNSSKG